MLVIVTTDPPETQAWIRQRLEAEFIAALAAWPASQPPIIVQLKEATHG